MDRDTTNLVRRQAQRIWGKKPTNPYRSGAKVVSTGSRPMVLVDGASEPTEATVFMDSRRGDRVEVEVSHAGVRVMGNQTSPATDNAAASRASLAASRAYRMADDVKRDVGEAYAAANAALGMAESAKGIVDGMDVKVSNALSAASRAEGIANGVEAKVDESLERAALANEAADSALATSKDAMQRATSVEQAVNSLNVRTTVGDEESLVRAHMDGVMVGKVGQSPCAYVNNAGSFDVVNVDWERVAATDSEGNPTGEVKSQPITRGTVATFGQGTAIREFNERGELLHEARMTPSEFVIENADVSKYLKVGKYAWKPRMDGSMSLIWE